MSTPVIITLIIAGVIVFAVIAGIVVQRGARKIIEKGLKDIFDDKD